MPVSPPAAIAVGQVLLLVVGAGLAVGVLAAYSLRRMGKRHERRYVRLRVLPYRGDEASAEAVIAMFETLNKRLLRRWWRRLLGGQPSISLEVHMGREAWLAISCPEHAQVEVHTALRAAYPNCRLQRAPQPPGAPPCVLRLKKAHLFIGRIKTIDRFEHDREPFMNRLLISMAAAKGAAFVQVALTPAPAHFERHAKRLFKRHEARLSRRRGDGLLEPRLDRSMVETAELQGGLEVQHHALFFADLRVVGPDRDTCEAIASVLRSQAAENHLVERGTMIRHGLFGLYTARVLRGEGNPIPSTRRGVYASTELAAIWQLPSVDFLAVPLRRSSLPVAPAPAEIMRAQPGMGTLIDVRGPVCIHPSMRRQNTAVVGTVEQGKTSYLVASMIEDLQRPRCAVILFDPKGDAADAALSHVPRDRVCTLLDFAHPTGGFNPLAVDAPADVIADYVVGALKGLFSDADIRASSDRYLRNAIIAVLAYDRNSTLWDAARLLSVGEDGYAYRARVGARVRELPELAEISDFFTAELSAQLQDARSTTTAKLDAPVNKLARLLNSPSIKRVLRNGSLLIDFERVIADEEVLIVKGALGGMGAGNTAVLMQLLIGMLDAALARQQDHVPADRRVAVALKVDEAPIVLNRDFAETMALKRSAGLETVACWQTNSQWLEREVREQLDALFAHRVYFATASAEDARESASLMMAQFSDTVRPHMDRLSTLGRPDARLHLPKHHAIASWSTPSGRQLPFVASTIPLAVDPERIAFHMSRQAERGGRYLEDLSRPHWDVGSGSPVSPRPATPPVSSGGSAHSEPEPPVPAWSPTLHSESELPAPSEPRAPSEPPASSEPSSGSGSGPPESPGHPGSALSAPSASSTHPGSATPPTRLAALPEVAADSFRELVAIDRAQRVRAVPRANGVEPFDPEGTDLALLTTIAVFRHVLSSQLHRRHGGGKAITGTQRRLKRLADAGLIDRFQLHASDGGGAPMCCVISPAGLAVLARKLPRELGVELPPAEAEDGGEAAGARTPSSLAGLRRDVHAAAWALALESALAVGERRLKVVGPWAAAISPGAPQRDGGAGITAPGQLRLPEGRMPHRFLCVEPDGKRGELERFETVRPVLRVRIPNGQAGSVPNTRSRAAREERDGSTAAHDGSIAVDPCELLVELDDRCGSVGWQAKLARYDHFLTGWSEHVTRYRRGGMRPMVVFVCRDRHRARECARRADEVLCASRAYAGERPADWSYTGREAIMFAAERDVHEGQFGAYAVPVIPPALRGELSGQERQSAPRVITTTIDAGPVRR